MSLKNKFFNPKLEDFSVKVSNKEPATWKEFKESLEAEIFGQDRAIEKITNKIMLVENSRKNRKQPISPLLFLGPPGSGKSELVEVATKIWLGDYSIEGIDPLVSIAGENYQEKHTVSTLVGAPAGYVGHNNTSSPFESLGVFDASKIVTKIQSIVYKWMEDVMEKADREGGIEIPEDLIEKMTVYAEMVEKRRVKEFMPFRSVLRVDEFEKMHPDVQKIFLGIMNDGYVDLRSGNRVDFRGCMIVFTGNLGSEEMTKYLQKRSVGFAPPQELEESLKDINQKIYQIARNRAKESLDPALYSRIGKKGIVVFHALGRSDYEKIIDKEVKNIQEVYSGKNSSSEVFLIKISDEFREFLLDEADSPNEGARMITRLIDEYVGTSLVKRIASGELKAGDAVLFTIEKEDVVIKRLPRHISKALYLKHITNRETSDDELRDGIYEELNKQFHKLLIISTGTPKLKKDDSDDDNNISD